MQFPVGASFRSTADLRAAFHRQGFGVLNPNQKVVVNGKEYRVDVMSLWVSTQEEFGSEASYNSAKQRLRALGRSIADIFKPRHGRHSTRQEAEVASVFFGAYAQRFKRASAIEIPSLSSLRKQSRLFRTRSSYEMEAAQDAQLETLADIVAAIKTTPAAHHKQLIPLWGRRLGFILGEKLNVQNTQDLDAVCRAIPDADLKVLQPLLLQQLYNHEAKQQAAELIAPPHGRRGHHHRQHHHRPDRQTVARALVQHHHYRPGCGVLFSNRVDYVQSPYTVQASGPAPARDALCRLGHCRPQDLHFDMRNAPHHIRSIVERAEKLGSTAQGEAIAQANKEALLYYQGRRPSMAAHAKFLDAAVKGTSTQIEKELFKRLGSGDHNLLQYELAKSVAHRCTQDLTGRCKTFAQLLTTLTQHRDHCFGVGRTHEGKMNQLLKTEVMALDGDVAFLGRLGSFDLKDGTVWMIERRELKVKVLECLQGALKEKINEMAKVRRGELELMAEQQGTTTAEIIHRTQSLCRNIDRLVTRLNGRVLDRV